MYLVYCTCACNHALHVSSIESVQVMAPSMVAIRWCGNGSPRYDGRVNQVPLKTIFADDVAAGLEVGKLVRVKWGGGGGGRTPQQGTAYMYTGGVGDG